jgi:4-amino-4-deoxy-L-arabinose transferase-like glycosyltransferase
MSQRLKNLPLSLAFIIVVAFIIRVCFAWWDLLVKPIPDEFSWEVGRIAQSIAMGKGFGNPYPGVETGPTALMAPLYPFLLGGIFKLFGIYTYTSYFVAVLINEVFSVLTCIPIFYLGKRIGGAVVGAAGAWLWAVFPVAVIVPAEWIWDSTLTTFALACILWATIEIRESTRVRDWAGYGVLWGFGAALNPSVLSVLPFILIWHAWNMRKRAAKWLSLPATTVCALVLCCMPWTIRNYVEFHHVIPFRSNFGLELWLGNNPEEQDILPDWRSPFSNPVLHTEYVNEGEVAFMKEKQAESFRYIESQPLSFLKFTWFRFIENWLGITQPFGDLWEQYSWNVRIPVLVNLSVVLLALSGVLALRRREREISLPFAIIPLVYPIVYYITHPNLRYRHPMDPVLIVLAAFAACHAVEFVARRKFILSETQRLEPETSQGAY